MVSVLMVLSQYLEAQQASLPLHCLAPVTSWLLAHPSCFPSSARYRLWMLGVMVGTGHMAVKEHNLPPLESKGPKGHL